jgi:hypothetical protein
VKNVVFRSGNGVLSIKMSMRGVILEAVFIGEWRNRRKKTKSTIIPFERAIHPSMKMQCFFHFFEFFSCEGFSNIAMLAQDAKMRRTREAF